MKLSSPWIKGFIGKSKYCQFCHHVEEHAKNCVWLYGSQLKAENERLRNRVQLAINILPEENAAVITMLLAALRGE